MHAARVHSGGGHILYYRDSAKISGHDCPAAGRHVPMDVVDQQVAELVGRLQLPNDWRERLQELAEEGEERENLDGKRRYLEGRLRRLRDLYELGDYALGEYKAKRADLQAQLDAMKMPQRPAVQEAGETLETLGQEWANAPKQCKRDMLRVIFEAVYVDPLGRELVCVKPWPPFAALFRMDGLEEREGCFYVRERAKEVGSSS